MKVDIKCNKYLLFPIYNVKYREAWIDIINLKAKAPIVKGIYI